MSYNYLMLNTLPPYVSKYFWGDDLSQLNWSNHQKHITQTLLNLGDEQAVSWLFQHLGKQQIINLLPELKLEPKSANFWKIYLS